MAEAEFNGCSKAGALVLLTKYALKPTAGVSFPHNHTASAASGLARRQASFKDQHAFA